MKNKKDCYSKEELELEQLADECIEESLELIFAGKLRKALETANRARNIYEELGDMNKLAAALNRLSIIYDELDNESMDMDCLLDALEIALDYNVYEIGAKAYNNIGSKFMNVKSNELALQFYEKSLDMYEQGKKAGAISDEDSIAFLLILNLNMAYVYCAEGEYEKCEERYLIAKANKDHPHCWNFQFIFQAIEGLVLWRIGKKDESLALVDDIMETARTTEYAADYIEIVSYIFELLKEMKDFDRWEKLLRIVENRLNHNEGTHARVEILTRWLEFYYATGNMDMYRTGCVMFYELTMEKASLDYKHKADTIELKAKMREAARQKKLADSIVYVDTLTGIGNRNKMLEDSKNYIADSIANDTRIAIGLVDIDFFKECNDTYGHIEGDACLKKVATILSEAVGDKGSVYRYGGDEFLILMPDATAETVNNMGKHIKDTLTAASIPNEKSPISDIVTVSQGYTKARDEEGDTIEHLVDLADHVLYSVKRYGRNNYKYMILSEIVAGNI